VLDNFEQLTDHDECVRLIADIVQLAPAVKVLITSRERLNLQREWLYEVTGLPPHDAQTLFTHTVLRAAGLEQCDDGTLARICRSVGGLPLGIELAASWTRAMSCADIAAELEHSATQLVSPLRDAPERHRSLQAVFEHSWRLLTPDEQRVLAALSIFRGGFTREAVRAVADASTTLLLGLVNQSLVQRLPSDRFDLHELVRQFAAGKAIEIDAIHDRHCAYYADFLAAHEAALRDRRQSAAMREINTEIDNVRVMWQHAIVRGLSAVFDKALKGVYWSFDAHGRQREGVELLAAAAARLKDDPAQAALYSRLLTRQASFHTMLGEFKLAEQLCQQAEALSDAAGDVSNVAFAVRFLGYFAMIGGDWSSAQHLMSRSLELYRRTGEAPGICDALNSLALVLNNIGEYDRARACLLEAAELAAVTHDEVSRSVALSNLGSHAYYTRQFEAARDYFQASYDIDAALDDRRRMAINLHNVACVQCDLEQWDAALHTQQGALALFTDMAHAEGVMHCRHNLARIHLGLNHLAEARRHVQEAFHIGMSIGAVRDSLEICVTGAELLRREGQPDRAAQVIGCVLHHSAATAAVQEDIRSVLARLDGNGTAIADAQPENISVAELVALIRG
jgi:predicted ATPase